MLTKNERTLTSIEDKYKIASIYTSHMIFNASNLIKNTFLWLRLVCVILSVLPIWLRSGEKSISEREKDKKTERQKGRKKTWEKSNFLVSKWFSKLEMDSGLQHFPDWARFCVREQEKD
jgi:hypothetical protein